MDEAEILAEAAAAWVCAVLPCLTPDQRQVFDAMLDGRCDVAIEVRLRTGTITLRAIDEVRGRFSELHREEVEPLRPPFHLVQ